MDGVTLTPLKQITGPKGDVFHAMKASDDDFFGFGEAYFSTVNRNEIKGWKKHTEMILNVVVIIGEVEFVIYNDDSFFSVKLSKNNYQRLTVKPDLWVAFRGIDSENMLLNIANIEHNHQESLNIEIREIAYIWSSND
jgi:dTDP-4-dehydrorhamnose 3,5-epimerase